MLGQWTQTENISFSSQKPISGSRGKGNCWERLIPAGSVDLRPMSSSRLYSARMQEAVRRRGTVAGELARYDTKSAAFVPFLSGISRIASASQEMASGDICRFPRARSGEAKRMAASEFSSPTHRSASDCLAGLPKVSRFCSTHFRPARRPKMYTIQPRRTPREMYLRTPRR